MQGVYKIYFKNDLFKFYIGRTINYESRKKAHLTLLRQNKHHSFKFQEYYNLNKKDIIFELIHPIDNQDSQKKIEQSYLDNNPYFNISKNSKGGKSSPEGLVLLNRIKKLPLDEFMKELKQRLELNCFYAIRYCMETLYSKPRKCTEENRNKFIEQWLTNQNKELT